MLKPIGVVAATEATQDLVAKQIAEDIRQRGQRATVVSLSHSVGNELASLVPMLRGEDGTPPFQIIERTALLHRLSLNVVATAQAYAIQDLGEWSPDNLVPNEHVDYVAKLVKNHRRSDNGSFYLEKLREELEEDGDLWVIVTDIKTEQEQDYFSENGFLVVVDEPDESMPDHNIAIGALFSSVESGDLGKKFELIRICDGVYSLEEAKISIDNNATEMVA